MTKIGMPTLIELDNLEDNIKLCKKLGLDFVEINMNFPQYQLDKLDADLLKALGMRYDVFFTFHLAEDIDIGHLNRRIRQAYVDEVLDVLALMAQIGSKVLNMHMSQGIYVTLPNRKVYIYDEYEEEYLENIQGFIDVILASSENNDIHIYIENTGIYDKSYIRKSVNMLIKHPKFRLTWDIGHDYSSGHKDKAFLLTHENEIKHYHIHDAIGTTNHLTLYDGEINIDGFVEKAEITGSTIVFETKTVTALTTSMERFKERKDNSKL